MGTRSGIGIKSNNQIKGIYCHYDGYLAGNGLCLQVFYKDKSKVESLIHNGDLRSLGANLYHPKVQFPDYEAFSDCHYASSHWKTTFCDRLSSGNTKMKEFNSDTEFLDSIDGEYFYLFDVEKNKWFVLDSDYKTKKIVYFELDRLLSDRDYFLKFRNFRDSYYIEMGDNESDYIKYALEEWDNIIQSKKQLDKQLKDGIAEICNAWLAVIQYKYDAVVNFEFGMSETKELGKHYVIFENLKQGESKRKVIMRSKNPNDLTLAVCKQFDISLYFRPFFDKEI